MSLQGGSPTVTDVTPKAYEQGKRMLHDPAANIIVLTHDGYELRV
jgi:hypothetical protein